MSVLLTHKSTQLKNVFWGEVKTLTHAHLHTLTHTHTHTGDLPDAHFRHRGFIGSAGTPPLQWSRHYYEPTTGVVTAVSFLPSFLPSCLPVFLSSCLYFWMERTGKGRKVGKVGVGKEEVGSKVGRKGRPNCRATSHHPAPQRHAVLHLDMFLPSFLLSFHSSCCPSTLHPSHSPPRHASLHHRSSSP